MNTHQTSLSIAVLTASASSATLPSRLGVAALSFELAESNDGWFQVLPAGYFKATDGRPKDVASGQWFLDEAIALKLIEATASHKDKVMDYEHQTLNSAKNGQPAPASGWFNSQELEWRGESGLWVKPRLTAKAKAFIDNKEYRYLSAVFPYDRNTGHPLSLHSIALTNDPGLDSLQPLASLTQHFNHLSTNPQESVMDREKLIALLGLAADATDDDITAAINKLKTQEATDAEKVTALTAEVAALKANPSTGTPDPTKFAPIDVVIGLRTELASLKATGGEAEVTRLLDEASEDGRIIASERDYLHSVGMQDIAVLKNILGEKPQIAALKSTQTNGQQKPKPKGEEGLTDAELEAAKLTGKTPKEFAALKASLEA